MTHDTAGFRGTERFRILKRLGAGGMGVVYSAHDRERDETVALKTLRWADASAIYRLKKEFRSLADLAHRNLVALYELIAEGDQWFFTMELVTGVTFLEHVRRPVLSIERLRNGLAQLAEGVAAIHGSGQLHRDLKPSNVLVTPEGRVVILDFGIASEFSPDRFRGETVEEGIWGSVPYMSPEQAEGHSIPPSDWYALGVMLYEALTGEQPFTGHMLKILADKQLQDPIPPDAMVRDLPADLVGLCTALLSRAPGERPDGTGILRRLGVSGEHRIATTELPVREAAVVGRERHLAELDEALARTRSGAASAVYVTGPSGMGKSTLVDRFLEGQSQAGSVVLTGRCYPRESVPYKGVDGVVDSLSRFLRAIPDGERRAVIREDLLTAVRLFPVLGRVQEIADLPAPEQPIQDPVELRRRGFGALRELFRRLATSQALLIHIDDLQWSDADSVAFLEGLLSPPDAPAVLLILSFRSEDVASQSFLGAMLARADGTRLRELRVGPLAESETRRLVERLLGEEAPPGGKVFEAIVRESAGSPFLVEQLVRHAHASQEQVRTGAVGVTLAEMLEARVAELPEEARSLLETLAVAGHPLDPIVARDAANLPGDERPVVALLRTRHLVRSRGVTDEVEIYHDRIRETLGMLIAPKRVPGIHLRLATAMEARGADDPEALYEHYVAGERPERAGAYAIRAGDKAARALAFERSAEFYGRALELAAPQGAELGALRVKLGDALASAGHGAEAADQYLAALGQVSALEGADLQRRAAEQLLRCGHVDRGLDVMRQVLTAVGLRLAPTPRRALFRILARRAVLRLRGLRFTARPADRIDPYQLSRIDICWAVAIGLARVDTIRATDFQVLHLRLALKAGEPYRVVRGLAAEAGFLATGGGPNYPRASRLVERARRLAGDVDRPEAEGYARFAAGFVDFWTGRFARAREHCEAAAKLFRERGTGVAWEINTAQTMTSSCLFYLGAFAELARRVPTRLREAREHGDLYAEADVAAGRPVVVWLATDDVAGARAAIGDAMRLWSPKGFHLQHYFRLFAEDQVDLYQGQGLAAWQRTMEQWRGLAGSLVLRVQLIRTEARHLRARCALAAAVGAAAPAPYLRQAARDARLIARERMPWATPLGHLITAAVSAAEGDHETATRVLDFAAAGFEAAGMAAYAAAARRRRGELLGGETGRDLIRGADAWFTAEGVRQPERLVAMLAPGFAASAGG